MESPDVEATLEKPDPLVVEQTKNARPRGAFGKLRYYEDLMDQKLGVEPEDLRRVPSEDRKPRTYLAMGLWWASATMTLSCFSTGFLGPEFGLSMGQSIGIIIGATLLGSAVAGWCASFGPATGLRQVAFSRYSMGYYPASIIAILNVVTNIGWAAVSCILSGLALSAVANGRLSIVVGIIILALVSWVLSFIGLKAVLAYTEYAWIVFFIIFMIMYGEAAPHSNPTAPPTVSGKSFSGAVLSLIAIVYGSSVSWCSIASDFYVYHPANTSRMKVFIFTTIGIAIPTCIGMILGACVASALPTNAKWNAAYGDGMGYLLQEILYPRSFSKFLLTLMVLSGVGMNCVSIYAVSVNAQLVATPCSRVPRSIWSILITACILLLSLIGRNNLLAVLQNFLSLLGYWETAYFTIVFSEHVIFRGSNLNNYDLDAWDTPDRLPPGCAGLFAFLCGAVGWIIGMPRDILCRPAC